jgi:hypothetical protein
VDWDVPALSLVLAYPSLAPLGDTDVPKPRDDEHPGLLVVLPRVTPERSRVAADASRDALAAGFVPGIALSWSWPDTLAHAVALAASSGPAGEVDLDAYERLLPEVSVSAQATE